MHKLNSDWINIMRKLKSVELKNQIKAASEKYQKLFERQFSLLDYLKDEYQRARDHEKVTFDDHSFRLTKIIAQQGIRVNKIMESFQDEVDYLSDIYIKEKLLVSSKFREQFDNLKDLSISIDTYCSNKTAELEALQSNNIDELRSKSFEDKAMIRQSVELRLNQLWQEYKHSQTAYMTLISEQKQSYDVLKEKDERSTAEIDSKIKKLKILKERINNIRDNIRYQCEDYNFINSNLREERDNVIDQSRKLKQSLNKLKSQNFEELAQLVVESDQMKKKLRDNLRIVKDILKKSEKCKQLETEAERVCPFPEFSVDQTEIFHNILEEIKNEEPVIALKADSHFSIHQILVKCDIFKNFWNRFNKVELERLALMKEKEFLVVQNDMLKKKFRSYLDKLNINDEIIAKNDSFLRVKKMNIIQK